MGSQVLDEATAEAFDRLSAGLDALSVAEVEPVDAGDATTVIGELEVVARRVRALQIEAVDAIDQRGLHRVDGHASAKVLVRHVAKLSGAEAARRAGAARALRDLPAVREAFRFGEIGSDQVDRIARAHANSRVRDRLGGQDEALVAHAKASSYRAFDATVTGWVRRVDEDGTCDRARRSHENRDAKMVQDFDGSWTITAGCGSLQGAELEEIFRRFIDAEFAGDWANARARLGDAATVDDLDRNDSQRRFDAFYEIFQRAAAAHAAAAGGSQVVTNIVIDQATFERHLTRLFDTDPGPPDTNLGPPPPTDTNTTETGPPEPPRPPGLRPPRPPGPRPPGDRDRAVHRHRYRRVHRDRHRLRRVHRHRHRYRRGHRDRRVRDCRVHRHRSQQWRREQQRR
ncbi:hypothetical protein BH20ACT3_BH20ACT3_06680 [soil metagenome]